MLQCPYDGGSHKNYPVSLHWSGLFNDKSQPSLIFKNKLCKNNPVPKCDVPPIITNMVYWYKPRSINLQ